MAKKGLVKVTKESVTPPSNQGGGKMETVTKMVKIGGKKKPMKD